MRIQTLSLIALTVAVACGEDEPETGTIVDPIVHVHSAGEGGIFVNGYIIETENQLVVIDTMLTVSDASAFRDVIDSFDKPLTAVLITHGHPDHYNGTTEITRNLDVPVIATQAVYDVISTDDEAKAAQWTPVFGDEWPPVRTFPTQIIGDGESVSFDGVTFTVHELGPGESHHDTYWVMSTPTDRPAAFIGDVVFNDMHAYLSDGHSAKWIANLDKLEADLEDVPMLYPGHGAPGTSTILAAQRSYLEVYRNTVNDLAQGQPTLTDEAKQTLIDVMMEHQPSSRLSFLIPLGADAVAQELASRDS